MPFWGFQGAGYCTRSCDSQGDSVNGKESTFGQTGELFVSRELVVSYHWELERRDHSLYSVSECVEPVKVGKKQRP